jgi:hypothetical protein
MQRKILLMEGKRSGTRNCARRGPTANAPVERLHGPIAEGRKPAGKGPSTGLTLVIRLRLPGRARNAPAKGQAGAAGFDAGQIRQDSSGSPVPAITRFRHNLLRWFE